MSGRRNGFSDKPDDDAEHLLPEQKPGDRLQAVCIHGDKGIADANRLHYRRQPLEHGEIQRHGNESERRNRAHAHDQRSGLRRGRNAERRHRPWCGCKHPHEDRQDDCAVDPVQDDQDAQADVGDLQRGR